MRNLAIYLGLGLLVVFTGCTSTRFNGLIKPDNKPTSNDLPSTTALVEYLNNNASRVQSARVDDLDITAQQGAQSFGLRGKMMTQKPRSFRMSADSFGNRIVDLGSNEQEFWYWISKAQPPYQFFCSYKDLNEGRVRNMPIPFQPDWIMETMGLGPYGPADKYKMESDADNIRLVEQTRSPQGAPVRKVIVFKRRPVQPPNPQVTAYLLIDDATNQEICSAHISEIQIDRATGAMLPRKIELRWPAEKLRLALKLDSTAINPHLPQTAFVRTPLQGVQSFDLARMQVDNVQRVQGPGQ